MSDRHYFNDVSCIAVEENERKTAELILAESVFVDGPTLRSFDNHFDRSHKLIEESIGSAMAATSIPRNGGLGFSESVRMNFERSTRHRAEGREGALLLPSTELLSRRRSPIRRHGV